MGNKIKNTILLVLLFAGVLLADWPVHNTTISLSNATSFDIFTNKNGNHIIVQESSILKYYKMNTSGSYNSPVTIENTSVVSPSITGDNNKLFIVYRITSETSIKVKTSTDGGSTWNYLSTSPTNSNADNIEAVFSKNYLHVTFSISATAYHAYCNTTNSYSWSSPQQISDAGQGGNPRIVSWSGNNENKVYFAFIKNVYEGKWREWDATNGYSSINQAYYQSSGASLKGIAVNENYVFSYYYYSVGGSDYLRYDRRSKSDNSSSLGDGWGTTINRIYSTTTADNNIYTSFYTPWNSGENSLYAPLNQEENSFSPGLYLIDPSNEWGNSDLIKDYSNGGGPTDVNLSSAGNESHVIWKDAATNYLDYAYKDIAPITPANFNLTSSPASHPYLSWNYNPEPDVYNNSSGGYVLERRIRGNTLPISWSSWSSIATLNGNISHYEDTYINNATGAGPGVAEYRLKANDNTYDSQYTNSLDIAYGISSEKIVGKYNNIDIKAYNLLQNFPNPFNPTTNITFSTATPGFVSLKVYNVFGKEVTVLVSEEKEAGVYSAIFDAKKLSSGIYYYTIKAGVFTVTKKMLLIK